MWFASVVYSFPLSFRSCVLLVLVGVGYIYACKAGMIIADEAEPRKMSNLPPAPTSLLIAFLIIQH